MENCIQVLFVELFEAKIYIGLNSGFYKLVFGYLCYVSGKLWDSVN